VLESNYLKSEIKVNNDDKELIEIITLIYEHNLVKLDKNEVQIQIFIVLLIMHEIKLMKYDMILYNINLQQYFLAKIIQIFAFLLVSYKKLLSF